MQHRDQEIAAMQAELSSLQANDPRSEIERLRSEVLSLRGELPSLTQELNSLRIEKAVLLRELEIRENQIKELTEERQRSTTEAKNSTAELVRLREDCARSEAEIGRLREVQDKSEREINELKARNASLAPMSALSIALLQPLQFTDESDFTHALAAWNSTLEFKDCCPCVFSDPIPVTNADRWVLCGEFQFVGPPGIIHFVGLDCYAARDANPATRIFPPHYFVVPDTEAELAEACSVGDQVLKVRKADAWPSKLTPAGPLAKLENIAFGVNELPNFNISSPIRECRVRNGIGEVVLTQAISRAWPAGTAMRLHRDGATYLYGYASTLPSKWTEVKMTNQTHPLRPGTNSVKVFILVCHYLRGASHNPDPAGCSLRIRRLHWEVNP
jgi:hypothetical protein